MSYLKNTDEEIYYEAYPRSKDIRQFLITTIVSEIIVIAFILIVY